MRKIILSLFIAFTTMSITSAAFIIEEFQLSETVSNGLDSFFNSGTGTQQLTENGGFRSSSVVTFSSGESPIALFSEVSFTATGAVTPSPKDGVPNSTLYDGGSWSIDFYSEPIDSIPGDLKIGTLSGTITWYSEYNADGLNNEPIGHGIANGVLFSLLDGQFGSWEWPNHESVILTNFGTLSGYDATQDWSSPTAGIIITSDFSKIPEPATMTLLGLGALASARRRRKT